MYNYSLTPFQDRLRFVRMGIPYYGGSIYGTRQLGKKIREKRRKRILRKTEKKCNWYKLAFLIKESGLASHKEVYNFLRNRKKK